MVYLVDGSQYHFSYRELQADYHHFSVMLDDEFMRPENLLKVLHFCCVCAYLKELGVEATVSDKGVIHELIHLALGVSNRPLREIRAQFEEVMRLA